MFLILLSTDTSQNAGKERAGTGLSELMKRTVQMPRGTREEKKVRNKKIKDQLEIRAEKKREFEMR